MDKKHSFFCWTVFLMNLLIITKIFSSQAIVSTSTDVVSPVPAISITVSDELSQFFKDLYSQLLLKDLVSNKTGLEKVQSSVSNSRETIKLNLPNIQDEKLKNRISLKDDSYKSLDDNLGSPKLLEKFIKKISTPKNNFTNSDCVYLKQLNVLLHESSSILEKTFLSDGQKKLNSFYDELGCVGKIGDILSW